VGWGGVGGDVRIRYVLGTLQTCCAKSKLKCMVKLLHFGARQASMLGNVNPLLW
jgi:hypothetical protein